MNARAAGAALAIATADAYSADRYASWSAVATMLLKRGYTVRQAEAILRSKWTRWAADVSGKRYGRVTATDLANFIDKNRGETNDERVAQLVRETFAETDEAEAAAQYERDYESRMTRGEE